MPSVKKILIIQDNSNDTELLRVELEKVAPGEFDIVYEDSVDTVCSEYSGEKVDAILLDLSLPYISGFNAISQIQEDLPELPIIVLTVIDNEDIALQAVQKGVQDYLIKGQGDGNLIKRSIIYSIERKKFEKNLTYLANYDHLTGLVNRTLFQDRLDRAIFRSERNDGTISVFFLDLDNFKYINDTLGHDIGDKLLIEVANRLREQVRNYDTIARLGGDEFIVIIDDDVADEPLSIQKIAQRIIDIIDKPFNISDNKLHITTSIGIASYPSCGKTPDTLIKNADIAMYRAKENGRNNYQYYTQKLNHEIEERIAVERGLHKALENDEFELHYQPIIDLQSGEGFLGIEALIRWRHPEKGLIPPDKFIPIAEESGFIIQIGKWVLNKACEDHKKLSKTIKSDFYVSVNVSASQIKSKNFVKSVSKILKEQNVEPENLGLEITETVIMDDPEHAIKVVSELKEIGINFYIDDFGTGYSSLSYLQKFPIDCIKIDRSFISNINENKDNALITTTVIMMSNALNLRVIAEGIETEEEAQFLRNSGCRMAQGYFFAKPMPLDQLEEWLK